jgi:hypothetical protein
VCQTYAMPMLMMPCSSFSYSNTRGVTDVRPQEQLEQDQPSSSTMVHPPTQDDKQVPQVEAHDQGGA